MGSAINGESVTYPAGANLVCCRDLVPYSCWSSLWYVSLPHTEDNVY